MEHSWLENLERNLEAKLDQWLADRPDQQILLENHEYNNAQATAQARRAELLKESHQLRQALLAQGQTIGLWHRRQEQARAANRKALADQCAHYEQRCRKQGQIMWERLQTIGNPDHHNRATGGRRSWRPLEVPLALERSWSAFVVEQELEDLRYQSPQS